MLKNNITKFSTVKYYDNNNNYKNKQWNMKVTVIPVVIGALGTVTKQLIKGLEDLEIR